MKQIYGHLLAPGKIGPLTLDNRVVLPAMDMNLCDDGVIEAGDIEHYAARAGGGVGLIITGACAVAFPQGSASLREPGLSDERFLPGLKALADAVHDAGSKLCVQMTHHGRLGRVDTMQDRPMLVPSKPRPIRDLAALRDNTPEEFVRMASASGGKRDRYHEAEEDDIAWLIERFTQAALLVQRSGADAVEIHCAHGYVLGGFLCRADNFRTDQWGGSLENRARLAVEVISSVRDAVGDSLAIIVRVAGKEYGEEDGLSTDEAVAAAKLFVAAGADAIHVTGWGRNPFRNFTDGPLPNKVGAYRSLAAAVKAEVSVPVISVGRVLPELGEEMIATGDCDFVAMGRQLLADPNLVNKLKAGQASRVRPCINCYVCVEQNFFDETPRCAVNPALGNEAAGRRLETEVTPTQQPKKVLVIGAGPGGLETARLAALRGHSVTVVDAGDRIGGTLWFSQLTTPDNERLLTWLRAELDRLGIKVQLGERATLASIKVAKPDLVVVATGARRDLPDVPGGHLPHVHTGDTLRSLLTGEGDNSSQPLTLRALGKLGKLTGITKSPEAIRTATRKFLPIGKDVVVIGGSLVGLELAEFLAERGRRVTLLEAGEQVGLPMAMPRRWQAVGQAEGHGVTIHRSAVVEQITPAVVRFRLAEELREVPADLVVVASGVKAEAPLAEELRAAGVDVHIVGDAAEVGYIEGAMHSAWQVATRL